MYSLAYYKNSTDKTPSEEYFYLGIGLAISIQKIKQQQTTYGKWKVRAIK
jgi:hypothetical protein